MFYDKAASQDSWSLSFTKAIDETITHVLASVRPLELREALLHGTAGGKRVRPMLAMVSCSAAGGRPYEALKAAAAIELLHASSLMHDDIMDHAATRRGKPTTAVQFGVPMAILAGDTLVALAFQLMQTSPVMNRERMVMKFTRAFLHTCEGQGMDLALSGHERVAVSEHRRMAGKKTARLLEAAAAIGAMAGTTNEEYIRALGRFGFGVGMAFQAKDDLLDQVGDERVLGKPVGTDRRNGKATFVSLPDGWAGDANGGATTDIAGQVVELTRAACSTLDMLPPSSARESLRTFAEALLVRDR
jgi:geranylgeranyl diphosphate synthase, type I